MKLTGRRKSSNVEDRRGSSGGGGGIDLGDILGQIGRSGGRGGSSGGGMPDMSNMSQLSGCSGGKGGMSLILVILVVVVLLFMCKGGSGGDMLNQCGSGGGLGDIFSGQVENDASYESTEEDESLKEFTVQVLGSTEDVWTRQFEKMGKTYTPPTLVLYSGRISTGCGMGSASAGPFYCSADQKVYIDLSFFKTMKRDLGADGDFAYAYVIAHEVGHHVQYLLGTLSKAHAKMNQLSQTEANKVSVQIELQADFLAGLWGHDEQELFGSLEEGDLEEALSTALVIGDDYLQKKAGYNDSRQYTHGTSKQRERWFKRGFTSGDINQGNTFSVPADQL